MGVDLNQANLQAAYLSNYAEELKNARKKMRSYKEELSVNWVGRETQYVYAGVDKVIFELDVIINELNSLQTDIKNSAVQIRQEEIAREEAERKAREEAERKAREEAARKAAQEQAAKEEAERKAREDAERKAAEGKKADQPSNKTTIKANTKKNSFITSFFDWF